MTALAGCAWTASSSTSWITVTSGIMSALAIYFFMLFLFDFVRVPSVVRAIVLLGTIEFIILTVIEVSGDKVRLGVEHPNGVTVHRREIYEAILAQREVGQGA